MKSMSVEEKAFMVLAASEEAQERTAAQIEELKILRQEIKAGWENSVKTLPEACKSQIKNAAMVYIDLHMKESLRGVKDSFRNLESASGRLKEELTESTLLAKKNRNILRFQGFWQIMQMAIAAVLILGVVFMISDITLKNRIDKLEDIGSQIEAAQATLDELQDKTWSLELVQTKDGTKGIVLPKGVMVEYTGEYLGDKSGRQAIVLKTGK